MGLRASTFVAALAALALIAPTAAPAAVTTCSLVTKAQAANALGIAARKLNVSRPAGDCKYWESYPGKRYFSIVSPWYSFPDTEYQLLMTKRYARMPKVNGVAGADLAVWQPYSGLQTGITVFARNQLFTLTMYGVPKAQAQPRLKALAATAITRLPA